MSMDASSFDMPRPDRVTTPAEFIAAMRALRDRAQLTYRQLERRAQAAGDRLPRSTIAAALSRDRIPRESTIASFVRACGGDRHAVEVWLAAHRRISAADEAVSNLADAVEAWLTGRPRPGGHHGSGGHSHAGGGKSNSTISVTFGHEFTQRPELTQFSEDPHSAFGTDLSAPGPDGAAASRVFADGRLANAVDQAKGDRWVGVHRRSKSDRWRTLVKRLRASRVGDPATAPAPVMSPAPSEITLDAVSFHRPATNP